MAASIETKLRKAFDNAETSKCSDVKKTEIWNNVSNRISLQQSVSSNETAAKVIIKNKYFLKFFSPMVTSLIVGVVLIGSLSLFFSNDNNTVINKKDTPIVNDEIIVSEIKSSDTFEIQDTINSEVVETSNVGTIIDIEPEQSELLCLENRNLIKENVVELNSATDLIEETSNISTDLEDNSINVEESLVIDNSIENLENDVAQNENEKLIDGEIIYEDSNTVFIRKPVIIENTEVKVVHKKSRFSKRSKTKN